MIINEHTGSVHLIPNFYQLVAQILKPSRQKTKMCAFSSEAYMYMGILDVTAQNLYLGYMQFWLSYCYIETSLEFNANFVRCPIISLFLLPFVVLNMTVD